MGIVFRVAFNNGNWSSPCLKPGLDSRFDECRKGKLRVDPPGPTDDLCRGGCWERDLCVNFEWGCTPEGRKFNTIRAYPGEKVFFVFKQPNSKYTLFAETTVKGVNTPPIRKKQPQEGNYKYFMQFEEFKPLPEDKWVKNQSGLELVNAEWRTGRYRFISADQVTRLENKIKGLIQTDHRATELPSVSSKKSIRFDISSAIYERLQAHADGEGRTIEEIIRQAIAEWLQRRKEDSI